MLKCGYAAIQFGIIYYGQIGVALPHIMWHLIELQSSVALEALESI